jgi:putative oxidoreductase
MKLGRLLLRLVVGGLFFGHGAQKLFGWFGGYGLDGTAGFFEQLGMRPGKRNAIAAGVAEAGGGAGIALGLATPLAASALIATMLTAIKRVHLDKGPWVANGGYEYNLVLIAAVLALAEVGPGQPSFDAALGRERKGPFSVLTTLGLGVAGAVGAHLAAEAHPVPPAPPEPAPESTPEPTPESATSASADEPPSANA